MSTTACHQNLFWSWKIQFTPNSFQIHCNINLPSEFLGYSILNLATNSLLSCVWYMSSQSHHLPIGFHNTQNTSNQPTSTPFHCPKTVTSPPRYQHKGPNQKYLQLLQNSSEHVGRKEHRTYNSNTLDSLKIFLTNDYDWQARNNCCLNSHALITSLENSAWSSPKVNKKLF